MNMPRVKECQVEQCAYNTNQKCHALAITIGGGNDALCDTYWPGRKKGGDQSAAGQVGACKTESCRYNNQLECTANGIEVMAEHGQPVCETYEER